MTFEWNNAKDWAKVYKGISIMYEGIASYPDERVFLSKETLKKCISGLKGRPVIIEHQAGITPENMKTHEVGYVTNGYYNNETGDFDCDFVVDDDKAKDLLDNEGYTLSTSYIAKSFGNSGTFINSKYDREITDLDFRHIAIVKNPRYERVKVYQNEIEEIENGGPGSGDFDHAGRPGKVGGSEPAGTGRNGKYEDGKKQWTGMKPKQGKLFEEKSEIPKVAPVKKVDDKPREKPQYKPEKKEDSSNDFDRILKEKQDELKQKSEKKSKKDPISESEKVYKDNLTSIKDLTQKADKAKFLSPEHIEILQELKKAKTSLTKNREAYAKSIMENFEKQDVNPYAEKVEAKKDYYKTKSEELRKSSDKNYDLYEKTRLPFGQPIVNKQTARAYKTNRDYFDKSMQDYKKSQYYEEKSIGYGSHVISSDDRNAILKLKEKLDKGVTSAEKRRIIDRVISIHEQSKKAQNVNVTSSNDDYSKYGFNVVRNTDINRLQLKFDSIPDETMRKSLKHYGFKWSPRESAWQRQLNSNADRGLRWFVEDLQKEKQNDITTECKGAEMDEEMIEIEQGLFHRLVDKVIEFCNSKMKDEEKEEEKDLEEVLEDKEEIQGEKEKEKENKEEDKPEKKENKCKNNSVEVDYYELMKEKFNSVEAGADDKIKVVTRETAFENGRKIYG